MHLYGAHSAFAEQAWHWFPLQTSPPEHGTVSRPPQSPATQRPDARQMASPSVTLKAVAHSEFPSHSRHFPEGWPQMGASDGQPASEKQRPVKQTSPTQVASVYPWATHSPEVVQGTQALPTHKAPNARQSVQVVHELEQRPLSLQPTVSPRVGG